MRIAHMSIRKNFFANGATRVRRRVFRRTRKAFRGESRGLLKNKMMTGFLLRLPESSFFGRASFFFLLFPSFGGISERPFLYEERGGLFRLIALWVKRRIIFRVSR